MIYRNPDYIKTIPDYTEKTEFIFDESIDNKCDFYIKSNDNLEFIIYRWNFTEDEIRRESIRIMGDAFERTYGDLAWKGIEPDRVMPWYMAVSNGSDSVTDCRGRFTECFGVAVQPDAFCSWKYDTRGITLIMDIKNGGIPVNFESRTIHLAKILFNEYRDMSAFSALSEFCKEMCPLPLRTDKIIYGSNNWYYAYGNSSEGEIIEDTKLIKALCKGNKNKPFMVIDDGWQINPVQPPWVPNDRFSDMKNIAEKMEEIGVIPGIWVRYLSDEKQVLKVPEEARRNGRNSLDPTHPAITEHVINTTKYLVDSGYKLIKHDFSTFDICGLWGKDMKASVCKGKDGFYDRTKTTAQVIKEFYRLILDNAGDTLILGCNTVSHLCAGLVHANRIGDDTSGVDWSRTRKQGVNTLAFRACQNNTFYIADADCVGITGSFEWSLNKKWLELVAESGTSLFVSCMPSQASEEIFKDLQAGFKSASEQKGSIVPIDWMENNMPQRYFLNGKEISFNWFSEYGADTL